MITHWTLQKIITKVSVGKVQLVIGRCMQTTLETNKEPAASHLVDPEVDETKTWIILELTCLWTIVTSRTLMRWKNKTKITKLNSKDFSPLKKKKLNNRSDIKLKWKSCIQESLSWNLPIPTKSK